MWRCLLRSFLYHTQLKDTYLNYKVILVVLYDYTVQFAEKQICAVNLELTGLLYSLFSLKKSKQKKSHKDISSFKPLQLTVIQQQENKEAHYICVNTGLIQIWKHN